MRLERIGMAFIIFVLLVVAIIGVFWVIENYVLPSQETAEHFHVWFQFIFGNWPLRKPDTFDRSSIEFSAALTARSLLGLSPIIGALAIFWGLARLRRQSVRYRDLLNLRDGLLIDAM
jgi:hypothetical protein